MSTAAQEFEATAFSAPTGRATLFVAEGRISARATYQELLRGEAQLVDVRDAEVRAWEGEVHPILRPLVIDPFLLEWRLDPRSETSLPGASYDARIVVLSGDGLSSRQLAEDLRLLGLDRAVDVVGGFRAWASAGLPMVAG